MSSSYEAISVLLLQLPHLRTLHIYNSPITAGLHSCIVSNSQLTTLAISGCEISEETVALIGRPASLAVQHLTIYNYSAPSAHLNSYFTNLFEGCIMNLISIIISDRLLPLVLTAAANRLLVLRELSISGERDEEYPTVLRLLALCPDLRALKNYLWDDCPSLAPLPDDALPNLEFITGSSNIVRALVAGRPVHRIHANVYPLDGDASLKLDVLQRSTVGIQIVRITCACRGLNDTLILLRSLHPLQRLNHLAILFYSLGDAGSAMKAISDVVVKELHQWPQLRICRFIDGSAGWRRRRMMMKPEEAECPMGWQCDLGGRGHPSLEELRLFTPFSWHWVPRNGWLTRASHDEFDNTQIIIE